jgi:hypothetical protein
MAIQWEQGLGTPDMTEHQRLFLVQAKTDYSVFNLLRKQPELPDCHLLHYLQMATELFGKAWAWKHGPILRSHRAFVGFLRSMATNRRAQQQLGYQGRNDSWEHIIRKSVSLAERIEDLAPALTPNGPNPEYPWPRLDPVEAPAEHRFAVWQDLQETAHGRQFLKLLGSLFAAAETFL